MLSGRGRQRGERPATFRDVLGVGEFRAIYAASALSWAGDYIARAAITALVFQITESVAASAAAFAISYAPWLLGGSLLVSLADRFPYRSVMVACDLARMVIMAVVAIPGLSLGAVMPLLLAAAVFSPPFDAARSATVPSILPDGRFVVGLGLLTATNQPIQVAGYFAGATLAAEVHPSVALVINAVTFGTSALLVRFGLQRRTEVRRDRELHLVRETVDGFRLVFTTPVLRAPILLVLGGSLFAVVPEALGAAWAAHISGDKDGWAQGMIMGAVPLGAILGALIVTRLTRPSATARVMRPLAVATPLALVPALLDPEAAVVALLAGMCGFAIGGLVPLANGLFVKSLPNAYRARAFGVVQGGLALMQGGAVLATGALAGSDIPLVVGIWSLCGVALMLGLSLAWPRAQAFAAAASAIAGASAGLGAAGSGTADSQPPPEGSIPGASVPARSDDIADDGTGAVPNASGREHAAPRAATLSPQPTADRPTTV